MTPRVPAPCVAVTIYGDLTGAASLARLEALAKAGAEGDFMAVIHDPPGRDEEALATLVRDRGWRLGYAWGVDPDVRLSVLDAAAQTRRRARLAAERGAELVELNGEAAWRHEGNDVGVRHPQTARARAMLDAVREGAPEAALSWTTYDHVQWHRLPYGVICGEDGVDLLALQYYAADTRDTDPETHREIRARMAKASAQLAGYVARGVVRPDLGPAGSGWTPYGQVHGLTTAGAAIVLDAAPITRAWALPSRVDLAGIDALEGVLLARRLTGHRGANALVHAQLKLGLAADGLLGPKTLDALRAATT